MNKKDIATVLLNFEEPTRSTLMALKLIILEMDKNISSSVKYGMPFFNYKEKMFCYLWTDKKTNYPYVGFVEGNKMNHPALIQGNRKRMKIFNVNPHRDIELVLLQSLLKDAIDLYKNGVVKIKKTP